MSMSLSKEIGGYFELWTGKKQNNIDSSVVALNLARNCIRYVIRAFNIKEIYIPYYTCPVVWQAINKEDCKINFYHIDKKFMPELAFPENSYILYTNYFGICSKNVKELAKKYKNLIVDNSQAFYMPKYGIASFNSIRKFFATSDGAFLESDKKIDNQFELDTSYQRFSHLLKRIDVSASFGYQDFCKNDDSFINEDIKIISNLTKTLFESFDINQAKQKRLENFKILANNLDETNQLKIDLDIDDVPLVYPYLVKDETLRKHLINNKVYVAQYWSPMEKSSIESDFQKYLIPLPIDQRYSKDDMNTILEVIYAKN